MISSQFEIILIASVVAVACALPGVFLVLRRMSLMSDAISHSILLGIVLAFFFVKSLASPLLLVGATLIGVLTVVLTELIIKTRKLKEDASIGLVFPLLFSFAVILISKFASHVHLDTDAVLLGELAFAPFDRVYYLGMDLGPQSLWIMGSILLLNVLFILLFYKELKLATFDPGLAASLGIAPWIVHYLLMILVSITTVGAFDAVGSILVVALMITVPATAYLLTTRLSVMLILSAVFGIASAVTGYGLAYFLDASIAGSMAIMSGVFFMLALLFSPRQGLFAKLLLHRKRKVLFAAQLLTVHLLDHEGKPEEKHENTTLNIYRHFKWHKGFAKNVLRYALGQQWIQQRGTYLILTSSGRETAKAVMVQS